MEPLIASPQVASPLSASLVPLLRRLADQADAAATNAAELLPAGEDPLPEAERAAWRRVLTGFAKSEGFEEWVMAPTAAGLAASGLNDSEVLRFFRLQGEDELRHEGLFRTYLTRHFGAAATPPAMADRLVYDGFLRAFVNRSARKPLRLLLPLLVFEKTGTLYLRRLLAGVSPDKPRLRALIEAIFRDEARHVAGVGATCRALVALDPPGAVERLVLKAVCRVVVMDMDRKAWWKPGLHEHMKTLGVDADAMNADNERVYSEICALLNQREADTDDARYVAG